MTAAAARAVPEGAIDARPIRPESDATLWDSAVARRDEIAAAIRSVLAAESVEALVLTSASGNYPPWVTLEAWLPVDNPVLASGTESERVLLEFVIDVKPYAEHRVVTTSRLTRGKRKLAAEARPHFQLRDAAEWARHAIGRGPRPSSYTPIVDALKRLLHGMLRIFPAPHRNRIDRRFRTPLPGSAAALLALAGLYMLGLAWFNGSSPQFDRGELPIIAFAGPRSRRRRPGVDARPPPQASRLYGEPARRASARSRPRRQLACGRRRPRQRLGERQAAPR